MFLFMQKHKWPFVSLVAVVLLAMLVAACGAETAGQRRRCVCAAGRATAVIK